MMPALSILKLTETLVAPRVRDAALKHHATGVSTSPSGAFPQFQVLSLAMVQQDGTPAEAVEVERAAPITSRFLFVDVAAQRAKQLRRGALPRLDRGVVSHGPYKLERVAMEEVRTGVIHYTLPTNYEGSPRGLPKE